MPCCSPASPRSSRPPRAPVPHSPALGDPSTPMPPPRSPPGALLVFVGLDRVGLGGGIPAALLCVLVGAAAPVAVAVTLRALRDEPAARTALPFLVLFPGAVWLGVSADGLFTGVLATGLA